MINKVKPFYIKITDDMTPQMVQDAFDKCVDAGADAEECIADTNRKHSYQDAYDTYFNYFGVDDDNITVLYDNNENYGIDAQEITLDQLDGWLGLEVEWEWKNGDECVMRGERLIYIGESIEAGVHCVQELGTCIYRNAHISVIEKPETPEQKAERERLDEINEIASFITSLPTSVKILPKSLAERIYDAGYRKQ